MNRSYSKKRHIQEANDRLEKRFLNEDSKLFSDPLLQAAYGAKEAVSEKKKLTALPQQNKAWFVRAKGTEHEDGSSTVINKIWNLREGNVTPGKLVFDVNVLSPDNKPVWEGQLSLDCNRTYPDFKWEKGLFHTGGFMRSDFAKFNYSASATPYHTNQALYDFIQDKGWCEGAGVKVLKAMTKMSDTWSGVKDAAKKAAEAAAKKAGTSKWDTTCDGESKPFKKMCKGETIKKVQGCLGITADGLFGSGTATAVKNKLNRDYFTNNDINTLCDGTSTNIGGGGTPALTGSGSGTEEDKIEATPEQL